MIDRSPRFYGLIRHPIDTTTTTLAADISSLCVKNDVGVICYSTLAKGFLTGEYRPGVDNSQSKWEEMVKQRYVNDRGLRILAALEEVAEEQHATQAEFAVAWLLAQPGIVAPIIGVRSVAQLNDIINVGRLRLGKRQLDVVSAASAP